MLFLLRLAWRDLKASGRSLWIFIACLALGVTLVATTGGLYQLINASLLADTRDLLGGDLEVDINEPLPANALRWIEQRGEVSLVIELDTMLGTAEGGFHQVELQSSDNNYPLYGELTLQPQGRLQSFTSLANGHWGLVMDPGLANKLTLDVGDLVTVGAVQMQLRALVINQPDRNLSANWRGTPVLLSDSALLASGLMQPGSRLDYEYHVKTDVPVNNWRDQFYQAFPEEVWEVRTFEDRSERIAERLAQIASGLIIIGFSTLFIGGLGVYNSIHSYLQGKMKTMATLQALGLRHRRLAMVYLLQIAILSLFASLAGVIFSVFLSMTGASVIAAEIPVEAKLTNLILPSLTAIVFGILTAFVFALPAIGKALSVHPAVLFRGIEGAATLTSRPWWIATFAVMTSIVILVLLAFPDPLFGVGFIVAVGLILSLLNGIVWIIQSLAVRCDKALLSDGNFSLRFAIVNLYRPGSPLRVSLLSLGSALTLMVACTLVVVSLIRTVNETIPEEAPALVFYDVLSYQLDDVVAATQQVPSFKYIEMAPIVRARLTEVNGTRLGDLPGLDKESRREAIEDEYKLSYLANNIDNLRIIDGQWWEEPAQAGLTGNSDAAAQALPVMAMEDREAKELGVLPGDIVKFQVEDQQIEVKVVAIYSQKGLQTRFWFEGIFSEGALDPFIHRYVGAANMTDEDAILTQNNIGAIAPNVISVRTASILNSARDLLGKATIGLAVVAGVSLLASLLVLISVMAAGRTRQIYEATVLHSLGARMAVIKRSLYMEYTLLALVTSGFAVILGAAIAIPLLNIRMKLPSYDLIWVGAVVAILVSTVALGLGARYFLARLKVNPASLLRNSG